VNELLILSLIIIAAFGVATFVSRIGIPRVSVYIIFGVLFSPELFGRLFEFPFQSLSPLITNLSLGIIAFLIGLEIDRGYLRDNKKALMLASFGESLLAVLTVGFFVFIYAQFTESDLISLKFVLALAAVAATTAPASTVAVIEEVRAKGPLVTLLFGIVIIDDAIGVLVFEVLTGLNGNGLGLTSILTEFYKIFGSLALGGGLGILSGRLSRIFRQEELRFPIFVSVVVLCVSAASLLGFSHILACMALGLATQYFSNQDREDLILPIKHIEELVFIVFFVFAGLHFSPTLFKDSYILILIYVFSRFLGKYMGAFAGAKLGGIKSETAKWVGLGLIPQAGVAIGLALSLSHKPGFEEEAKIIINIVLGSTIIYEILGPILARYSLLKSGASRSHHL